MDCIGGNHSRCACVGYSVPGLVQGQRGRRAMIVNGEAQQVLIDLRGGTCRSSGVECW